MHVTPEPDPDPVPDPELFSSLHQPTSLLPSANLYDSIIEYYSNSSGSIDHGVGEAEVARLWPWRCRGDKGTEGGKKDGRVSEDSSKPILITMLSPQFSSSPQ